MRTLVRPILYNLLEKILRIKYSVYFTDNGNRSAPVLNYRAFLQNPHFLRLLTEYKANGNFSGHLIELSKEDAFFVKEIKTSLEKQESILMKQQLNYGSLWDKHQKVMLSNILSSDDRNFNHIGALNFKTFEPQRWNLSTNYIIEDILLTQTVCDYLLSEETSLQTSGLFVDLNAPYFTLNNHKLNKGIWALEVMKYINKYIHGRISTGDNIDILEIGAGDAQLANVILKSGKNIKYIIVDLPSMHSRGPFFLYKNGFRVCLYHKFLEFNRSVTKSFENHDVIFLPPWEVEAVSDYKFNLAINVRSLSEMPSEEIKKYLKLINKTSRYFFSLNTNTYARDIHKGQSFEKSCLDFKPNDMKLIQAGTTIFDSALRQFLHHCYALYSA